MNFTDLQKDISDNHLPRDIRSYEKIKTELTFGKRVRWYFQEELDFFKSERLSPRKHAPYSGIIIPIEDIENRGGAFDPDDCIVVMDQYSCEKCNPDITWVALKKLIDCNNLIEIF